MTRAPPRFRALPMTPDHVGDDDEGSNVSLPPYTLKEEDDHTKHTVVDLTSTLIRGSAYAMRCFQNIPRVRCVLALKQKREALLGPPFSFEVD